MLVRPLIAITTPVCAAMVWLVPRLVQRSTLLGHVGGAGEAGFWHSPSGIAPRTALPLPSLIKIAATLFGFGLGTAIGSELPLDVSCIKQTRACALIFGTKPPKNQGRLTSVPFTSTPT